MNNEIKNRSGSTALTVMLVVFFTFWMNGGPLCQEARATDISGMITSDDVWTTADDPYIVVGDVTIAIGVTVTVEAGVEIRFEPSMHFNIDGIFRVLGTAANPVVFTANGSTPVPGSWGVLKFRDHSDDTQCILSNAIFEYGSGVTADQAAPTIEDCTIRYHSGDGLSFTNSDQHIILSGNTIESNTSNGLYLENTKTITLTSNTMSFNSLAGIYLGWTEATTLAGNTIDNNTGAGISFSTSGFADLLIQNCTLTNNTTSGLFDRNDWDDFTRSVTVDHSDICGNSPYDIRGGIGDIDATDNWWCTTNPADIPPRIYDYFDYYELGVVSYLPLLSGPTLAELSELMATRQTNGILVQWQTSTETDIAGFHLWTMKKTEEEYVRITDRLIPAEDSGLQGAEYSFLDAEARVPGQTYWYQLEAIDATGKSTFHGPISRTQPSAGR